MSGALLVPELAEVYLLLDHVSAVASARLPDLSEDPVFAGAGKASWVQQICDIRWPPDPDQPQDEALNATKLFRAKDALNGVAYPASGSSIAFTLIISGEAGDSGGRGRGWRQALAQLRSGAVAAEPTFTNPRDRLSSGQAMSRRSLAAIAYPGLDRGRTTYRLIYYPLNMFLLLALCVTCYLSWTVATGTSMLNRVSALTTTVEQRAPIRAAVDDPNPNLPAQDRGAPSRVQLNLALGNLGQFVEEHPFLSSLVGGHGQATRFRVVGSAKGVDSSGINLEWAAVFIGVLAGTVLPIAYGVLGASAAVVRNIAARMGSSTLTPRALIVAVVQLGLGAVIGACVGLFVNSDGNGAANGQGLLGPVHLSSSALCFLGGFGVEGVFRALEALVMRVFPAGSTPAMPGVVPLATVAVPASRMAVPVIRAPAEDARPLE